MLISSHRHRSEDLRLWKEYEDADRIHGERIVQSGKVERSLDELASFAAKGACYAGTSWGKDSTVLCHLIALSGLAIPVYHFVVIGHDFPETDATRDAFLSRWPLRYQEIFCHAIPGITGWDLKRTKIEAAKREIPSTMRTRWIHGLRLSESAVRKLFFRKFGLSSKNSCGPIGFWSVDDVYGYLAYHDLPIHPSYAMLGGGRWPRQHLRVSPVGGTMGDQFGRREWELEYYGDVLRRLEAANLNVTAPEVS